MSKINNNNKNNFDKLHEIEKNYNMLKNLLTENIT